MNEDLYGYSTEIYLSKCLRCRKPFLKEKNFQVVGGEDFLISELQFSPNIENEAIKDYPKIAFNPYKEALKCYRAHAYDVCVIMCRKGV